MELLDRFTYLKSKLYATQTAASSKLQFNLTTAIIL